MFTESQGLKYASMETVKPFQTTTDTISKIPAKKMNARRQVIKLTLRWGKLKFTKKMIIATLSRSNRCICVFSMHLVT